MPSFSLPRILYIVTLNWFHHLRSVGKARLASLPKVMVNTFDRDQLYSKLMVSPRRLKQSRNMNLEYPDILSVHWITKSDNVGQGYILTPVCYCRVYWTLSYVVTRWRLPGSTTSSWSWSPATGRPSGAPLPTLQSRRLRKCIKHCIMYNL